VTSVPAFAARYAGRHWSTIAALVALALLNAVAAAVIPWPLKYAVDGVLGVDGSGKAHMLLVAAAALVAIVLCGQALLLAQRRVEVGLARQVTIDVGADLFSRLQLVSLTDARRYRVGDVVSRVTRDAAAAASLILGVGVASVQRLALVGVYTVVLWRLDPFSGVIALAVAMAHVAVARRFARTAEHVSADRAQAEADLLARVDGALAGLPEIWVNDAVDRETARFSVVARRTFGAARRSDTLALRFGLSSSLLAAIGTGAVLLVGAQRVLSGDLTVGGLLVILSYLQGLQEPVEGLTYALPNAAAASARARRVIEFLPHAEPRVVPAGGGAVVSAQDGLRVEFRHVGYAYDHEPVLHDISLTAEPGTVTALVGPTGAGKTTLVSLLPRLIEPATGSITINGVDHRQIPIETLRNLIAVVRQEPYLFPVPVYDNIAYGRPDATAEQIVAAAKAANAHDFIEALPAGYQTVIGDGGSGLSGGQGQRLAIARALLKNAPILILDEPTSALDAGTEAAVMDAIDRLIQGRTVFVIAHRFSTIRSADTIAVLDHGRIAEQGTHSQLLATNGLYATLHAAQSGPEPTTAMADPQRRPGRHGRPLATGERLTW
jgi:ATP-binding cassette subfamily B protein/subfamily B ATP-binding cassette protein MsbA